VPALFLNPATARQLFPQTLIPKQGTGTTCWIQGTGARHWEQSAGHKTLVQDIGARHGPQPHVPGAHLNMATAWAELGSSHSAFFPHPTFPPPSPESLKHLLYSRGQRAKLAFN